MHGVFSRWDAMVGRDVAQHVRPVSYVRRTRGTENGAGGRLVVQTDSTAWATQMRLLAPTVVRRLNEELGDGTVRVIEVQGPNRAELETGPTVGPGRSRSPRHLRLTLRRGNASAGRVPRAPQSRTAGASPVWGLTTAPDPGLWEALGGRESTVSPARGPIRQGSELRFRPLRG